MVKSEEIRMEIQKQRWSRVFAGWNMKTRGDEENKKKSEMGGGGGGPEGRELVECKEEEVFWLAATK